MINYRYNILRNLGEGGSGVVFLVEDTLNQGRQSAMKILHHEGQSGATTDDQLRNEVSVLTTLHHPNLVRVFDSGLVRHAADASLQGRRFFTMEYVQGEDVLQWYRSLRSDQERVVQIKHLMLQALGVLSYIHHQGIIHFDIKPENLLLVTRGKGEDGIPLLKLTDFGFSVRHDDSLDLPLRGTLEYTAPELLRHEAFDHRVDLYSMGATLYRLIEGRCPFEANEPVELIKKVLTTEPDFEKASKRPYTSFLPVLKGLLEKSPDQRFGSAKEVTQVLLPEGERSGKDALEVATKPTFAGRREEKERISHALSHIETEGEYKGGDVAIVISGPEGIGKTALLGEAMRLARSRDITALEMNIGQRDVPFGAIRSLLLLLRAEVMSRSVEGLHLVEKYTQVIDGGFSASDDGALLLQREWIQERDKVTEAQARFIHLSSMLFPFIIVIDNGDRLDSESAEVVRIATRDARPGRFLLLASERGELLEMVPAVRMQLRELDAASVNAMGVSVFAPAILGEAIGNRLFSLYGGSPDLIVEAIRYVETLLSATTPPGSAGIAAVVDKVMLQLPSDIDHFLINRYRALDRERQLCLEILSCFRSPVVLELIQAVLPFQRQRTLEYLSSLEADGFLASHEAGRRFSMRHARLKTIVNSASTQTRQDVHVFIATTMEQHLDKRSFSDLQEVAYQYADGGKHAESITWLERAADEGMLLAAYQRGKELYEEAVLLGADADAATLARLRVKLAHAMFQGGAYREAIDLVDRLLTESRFEKVQTQSLHKTAGLAHSRLGNYEESKRHIAQALDKADNVKERLELQQELVGIDIALGNAVEAERVSIIQLEQARQLGDQRIIASIHTDLGIATFLQDLFERSVGYFQEAMETYAHAKQHARLADAIMNVGNVLSAKGDITHAMEYWNKALSISQEYGTLNQQAQIQNNLGIANYKLKRYGEAKKFYDDARGIFSRIDSKQGTVFVLTNLGEVCLAECEYEKALQLWEEALAMYRAMDDARGLMETLLQLSQVRQVLGDHDSVILALDEAETVMNEKGLDTFRSLLFYDRGMLLMFTGKMEQALQTFAMAGEHMSPSGEMEKRLLVAVRKSECNYRLGKIEAAVTTVRDTLQCGEKESIPQIIAESSLLLGMIARKSPQYVQEKALTYLKKGMDAIAREPIAEITWRLAFALGQEYYERGQHVRARESFVKAKVVLQFIVARFQSIELKTKYLGAENKADVLVALEKFLNT